MLAEAFAYQELALDTVDSSAAHILVVAPTGAGKTRIGLEAIRKSKRGIYVCPTRALCYEKYRELREHFPKLRVALANQDFPMSRRDFRDADIRVVTPFKLLDFVNNLPDFTREAPVVVLDEVDSMNFEIEVIYALLLALHPGVRIVALSGTISDGDVPRLQHWLGRSKHCEVIQSSIRPKQLVHHVLRTEVSRLEAFGQERKTHLWFEDGKVQLPAGLDTHAAAVLASYDQIRRVNDEPVLVWSPRRYFAGTLYQACISELPKRSDWKLKSAEYLKELDARLDELPEPASWASRKLREGLRFGIGLHHGGILPEEQRLVEELSKQGALEVVVGCLSMCRGIHHPFGHVVVSTVRDPAVDFASPLIDISQYVQVCGRAGRVGFGSEEPGHVWTICQTRLEEVEVRQVLHTQRASSIKSSIDSSRTLTIVLAGLIYGDTGNRFRRRDQLLNFVRGLYSASSKSDAELEELLEHSLEAFSRYGMLEERNFGYWFNQEGLQAARLGVHPREFLAMQALCEENDGVDFDLWIEVLGELFPEMMDCEVDVSTALEHVQHFGLAVYSEPGLDEHARPVADYVQRLLDRVKAYYLMLGRSEDELEQWREQIYLRFILGSFQTAWALSEAISQDGVLRRLVRSLGTVLAPAPEALDEHALRQIAHCLYQHGRQASLNERRAVAAALGLSLEEWSSYCHSNSQEEDSYETA